VDRGVQVKREVQASREARPKRVRPMLVRGDWS
jgi:hypothetical protein